MDCDQKIYTKSGEVFLQGTDNCTILCCHCSEIFYEFDGFRKHSIIHAEQKINKDDCFLSDLAKNEFIDVRTEFIRTNTFGDSKNGIQFLNQNIFKIEKEIKSINSNNLTSDKEKLESIEEIFCPHCKIFFKCHKHNLEKCAEVRAKIVQYDAYFEKLVSEGIYVCKNCSRYFSQFKDLYEHHQKAKHCCLKNQCKICSFSSLRNSYSISINQNPDLIIDKKIENELNEEKNQINCSKCSSNFILESEYDLHLKIVHEGIGENTINLESNDETNSIDSFGNNNININDYTCKYCNRKFKQKSYLEKHEILHANGNLQFKCSLCLKVFTRKYLMQMHMRIHTNELPYKCELCSKPFRRKCQLQLHMRIHTNNRPYKCELCPSAFTVFSNLKNHIVYKHTDEKPFACEFEGCKAKFKLHNLKKQHEKRHLPAHFQCEICGNDYTTKFSLLKHQQSKHVDAENWRYQCEICQKRFAKPQNLKDHKRIHTGEKPFGCDVCSKFFRKRSALREHKRLHSDERKYVCAICGKGFKQVAGYWGHMKRHPMIS